MLRFTETDARAIELLYKRSPNRLLASLESAQLSID